MGANFCVTPLNVTRFCRRTVNNRGFPIVLLMHSYLGYTDGKKKKTVIISLSGGGEGGGLLKKRIDHRTVTTGVFFKHYCYIIEKRMV